MARRAPLLIGPHLRVHFTVLKQHCKAIKLIYCGPAKQTTERQQYNNGMRIQEIKKEAESQDLLRKRGMEWQNCRFQKAISKKYPYL